MTKILFINAPYTPSKSCFTQYSIGQWFIASNLKKYDVKLINCFEYDKKELFNIIHDFKPDHLGITLFSHLLKSTKRLIGDIKTSFPNIIISIGGPMATITPVSSLYHTKADFVFAGEADKTYKQMIDIVKNDNNFLKNQQKIEKIKQIPGITFFKSYNEYYHNPGKPCLSTMLLSKAPQRYLLLKNLIREDETLYLSSSRGCPFNCVFCTKVHGNIWRGWSSSKIINELLEIQNLVVQKQIPKIMKIGFMDDDFAYNRKRFIEFARLYKEQNLNFQIMFQSNISSFLKNGKPDIELIKAVKDINTSQIAIGTDALCEEELKNLNKPYRNIDAIDKLMKEFYLQNIDIVQYLIIFNPDTTIKNYITQIYNACLFSLNYKNKFHINIGINPVYGSKFFERVQREKIPFSYIVEECKENPAFNYPIGMPVAPNNEFLNELFTFYSEIMLNKKRRSIIHNPLFHLITLKKFLSRNAKNLEIKKILPDFDVKYEVVKKLYKGLN